MIRLKQKRSPKLKIAILFIALLAAAGIFLITRPIKALVASTQIRSSHANYENEEQGAWRITQTATASDTNTAKLTIKAESILKGDGKDKDIFVMMDTSGSMTSDRIDSTTNAVKALANTMLDDRNGDNRMAFSVFNTNVADVTNGFVDDAMIFRLYIGDNLPPAGGGTDYYKAIQKIDDFFSTYEPSESRNAIVLFITDGAPVENHPLEESEYQVLKQKYPWLTVQGIQFEMGDEVIEPIKKVSDNQFASSIDDVEDVVFEAAQDGYKYSEFVLNDYINEDYYEIDSLSATAGEVAATLEGNTPKITWNMSNVYRSGTKQVLTVNLNVKQACLDKSDSLCDVNRHTSVSSKLPDSQDESIDTTETPILQFRFVVSYDLNAPSGCDENVNTVPATTKQIIYSSVEISDYVPTCAGFRFQGWTIISSQTSRYNDNYFRMPEEDVILRAIWSKPSISKSMEGTTKPMTTATFKKASPSFFTPGASRNGYASLYSMIAGSMSNIEHIEFSDGVPSIDAVQDDAHDFSDPNSELPIYGHYDAQSKTFYFYSDADKVYLNADSRGLFAEMGNLKTIGDMSKLLTDNVKTLDVLFYRTDEIESYEGLLSWTLPALESLEAAFYYAGGTNLHGLENWDVSHVTNMHSAFEHMVTLKDISALASWQTSTVENMSYIFNQDENIQSLHGLENWNVGNVTTLASAFRDTLSITSFTELASWRPVKVTTLSSAFEYDTYKDQALTSLTGLEDWKTPLLTNLYHTFAGRKKVTSLEPLRDWDVHSTTSMEGTFNGMASIESLDSLTNWNTGSVETLSSTFSDCSKLVSTGTYSTDDSLKTGVAKWDTSKVKNMDRLFWRDEKLASLKALTDWNTSGNTSLLQSFAGIDITTTDGLQKWNVEQVTSMSNMLEGNKKMATIAELYNWQTNSLKNIANMLSYNYRASALTSLHGLENWKVGQVTTMKGFCFGCNKLTSISELNLWRPVALMNMTDAFNGTAILASLDGLQDWKTPELQYMEKTFANSKAITNVAELSDWMTSKVTTFDNLFVNDESLVNITALSGWNTGLVENMNSVFESTAITSVSSLAAWNTENVKQLAGTFYNTKIANTNGLSGWNVQKVETMWKLFGKNTSLTNISDLQGWTTTNKLTRIETIFSGDTGLTNLTGLSGWDVSGVTNASTAFKDCTHLTDISALAGWSIGSLKSAYDMFNNSGITSVEPLRGWNVESVTSAQRMFQSVTGVEDFTPLNSWQFPSNVNKTDIFKNVLSTAQLPSWN